MTLYIDLRFAPNYDGSTDMEVRLVRELGEEGKYLGIVKEVPFTDAVDILRADSAESDVRVLTSAANYFA